MVLRLEGSWSLLVGKRFLSLSEEDDRSWDTSRISEWPWKSGRIRAVSHTDISKQDLKVTGNFQRDLLKRDCLPWDLETSCACMRVGVCIQTDYIYIYTLLLGERGRLGQLPCLMCLKTYAPLAKAPSVLVLMPEIISS